MPVEEKIDEKDAKLMNVLVSNARMSLVDLSKKTGLTIDIIRGRMKKLEGNGIIVKYSVDVDFNALGLEYFKAFLYLQYSTKGAESKIIEFCRGKKEVISLYKQISEWDLEIGVMAEGYQEFNKFIREVKNEFHDIVIDTEAANVSEGLRGQELLF